MPRFSECWRCGTTIHGGVICQLCDVAKYCSEKCQRNDIFRHEAECIPASILQTCKACRKSGRNLKACTGCYLAFYCDTNCQKGNWGRHKIDCLDVKEKIESIAQHMIKYFFSTVPDLTSSSYYYWGNVPAFDCLNLVENEGEEYGSELRILFLGVGDLRNVALTCASLPDSYKNRISFTLNDKESCVLARLVLFLYMLIKGETGIEKTVTELWYSILLSKPTYKCLTTTLKELLDIRNHEDFKSAMAGLISIDGKQLKELQRVWAEWHKMRVKGTTWIQEQRRKGLREYQLKVNSGEFTRSYVSVIPLQHSTTAMKWIEDGIFQRTQMQRALLFENPTLTGYDQTFRDAPYSYMIEDQRTFPFNGWDYVEVKKFKNSSCLVTMFGDYIESILRRFMKKLSEQQVSFDIVLCDCMDIKQHLEITTVYDRILTSNLMDYIMLPVLLRHCSELLNHENTCATIVTETISWDDEDFNLGRGWSQESEQSKIALEDARRPPITNNKGYLYREYVDDSNDFNLYLRSVFHAFMLRKSVEKKCKTVPKPLKLPILKELGNEFHLRLRDYLRNENKIGFYKQCVNRRSVNFTWGDERLLEWIPLPKKKADEAHLK